MRQGFSLVELSIVLVILGLLTGGILAGQSLIRASELRAVSTEYQRYVSAINTFRDKYFAVPGDMSTATKFWGTAGTCPGTNASPSTTQATCDGDGNGQTWPNPSTSNELFRFWQHLANAGLIEGSYTGVPNSATASDSFAALGTNAPKSKLGNAGWTINYVGPQTVTSVIFFEGSYGNLFYFGAVPGGGGLTSGNALKTEEAWNIDTKMDDGKPGTGGVIMGEGNTACHDAGTSNALAIGPGANYALSSTSTCPLFFKSNTGL